jgi:probable phosphoglycerate mutase
MKEIYFVRHGESEANVGEFHGKPSTPMTQRGHEQALFIAQRCSSLPLQALITSTYTRAKQTAGYIADKIKIVPEESDLFVENGFVSALWDARRSDPASQSALKSIIENWGVPGYHFADEENFEEIVRRVDAALAFLSERSEEHIGVVTHGGFLRNVVGRAMFGDAFTPEVSDVFFRALHVMENTGLTILSFGDQREKTPWKLRIWNDHAHLG